MTWLILSILLALVVWPRVARFIAEYQERRRFAIDIANAKLIQGPRLIRSEWEGDATVLQRAETLRGLLALSGNTWIEPEQIVVRVFHPHAGDGKTVLTFEVWRAMVDNEFAHIAAKYHNSVAGQFAAPVFGQTTTTNVN